MRPNNWVNIVKVQNTKFPQAIMQGKILFTYVTFKLNISLFYHFIYGGNIYLEIG